MTFLLCGLPVNVELTFTLFFCNQLASFWSLLVGAANVRRAKIAADMVKQGKAVPAPVMVAYAPIVTMIDDIAKGGYTFVKLLQVIHARAKNKK